MHLQRNATQRNATQRNAYQNYILLLTNNFKFYISQFISFYKVKQSSCSFLMPKKNQKSISFFVKKRNKKTTPFRIQSSIFFGLFQFIKNQFEIISQSYYGFCYKNYFFNLNQVFRNNYDFCESFERNSNYDFEKNYNFGFGKNDFGNCNFGLGFGNMIYDIGNNLKGFLFNRKINSKKILFQKEKKR